MDSDSDGWLWVMGIKDDGKKAQTRTSLQSTLTSSLRCFSGPKNRFEFEPWGSQQEVKGRKRTILKLRDTKLESSHGL
jgi:hypothetical protein